MSNSVRTIVDLPVYKFTSFSPAGQEGRHRPKKHSRMHGKEEGMSHENKRSISRDRATIFILGSRRASVAHYTAPYTLFRGRVRCSRLHSLPKLSDLIT